jgi:hypothetical protein
MKGSQITSGRTLTIEEWERTYSQYIQKAEAGRKVLVTNKQQILVSQGKKPVKNAETLG